MTTVYITAPRGTASELAKFLVEERLAACVNIVDCDSTYRWENEMYEDEEEAILFAKTTAERYPELKRELTERHTNDVPCIERFDQIDVIDSFANWVETETR
ncbi:divalent-cation tolerance protein CutA [Haloquadratum walsbyi]|uniref:Divalent cation tolerance protein n=1 Tax=Haloquadratum walsbyi J07HQW2 TaxID=1238425 RepID=U1PT89_9EURY|nr:divalent cation tolerance protein CutA [Haloquadratum walsbyi]ERG97007.1 MAG: divalent cation tolerance protein [Haloquadratum walsbyi J07HQW2]